MYVPAAFAESDEDRLFDLVDANPFGLLVTQSADGPVATPLPFHLDRGRRRLEAHLARANPLADALADGTPVLCVFQGPHAYVSPRWFARPGVPTWNYAAVQIRGPVARIDDASRLLTIVDAATRRHEGDEPEAWTIDDLDDTMRAGLLRSILGIEIAVEEIVGKVKLSQNRTRRDRRRIAAALSVSPAPADRAVARIMRGALDETVD